MKKSPTELINIAFSILMVIITFTGSVVFLFTDLMSDRAYGNKRIVLGVIFLTYAIYRTYRTYSTFK